MGRLLTQNVKMREELHAKQQFRNASPFSELLSPAKNRLQNYPVLTAQSSARNKKRIQVSMMSRSRSRQRSQNNSSANSLNSSNSGGRRNKDKHRRRSRDRLVTLLAANDGSNGAAAQNKL